MQCNIDARGKAARLMTGLALIVVAIGLLMLIPPSIIVTIASVGLLLAGVFAVFEGWAGWCVFRAMGFHTRI